MRKVVVTGLGAVTPLGNNVEETWEGIKAGKSGIGLITKFDTTEYADFVTAYTNLEEKYLNPLMTGSIALADVLPSIQEELESIGFYEILATAQAEFDAYLAQ